MLSVQVLEHVRDLDRYLAEAARVLKDDGTLLLSTLALGYTTPPRRSSPLDAYRTDPRIEARGFVVQTVGRWSGPRPNDTHSADRLRLRAAPVATDWFADRRTAYHGDDEPARCVVGRSNHPGRANPRQCLHLRRALREGLGMKPIVLIPRYLVVGGSWHSSTHRAGRRRGIRLPLGSASLCRSSSSASWLCAPCRGDL